MEITFKFLHEKRNKLCKLVFLDFLFKSSSLIRKLFRKLFSKSLKCLAIALNIKLFF